MQFITDPTGHFGDEGVPPERLLQALGVLPLWAIEACILDADIKDHMAKRYQFGIYETKGGVITPEGVFKYPEDPLKYPYAKLTHKENIVWFYDNACLSINGYMTRMD